MQILTSLHGRSIGLGPNGELIVPSGKILLGPDGAQVTEAGAQTISMFEDFLGPTLTTRLAVTAGSDSPAGGAISIGKGGIYRLTTGDSNASLAADGVQLAGSLNWYAQNDGLTFEARVKVSAITAVQLFVGLSDQIAALEMPVTLSGTTFTTVATDAVGFLLDTTATTPTIRLVGVANDVDATMQDSGLAYVAATYITLRVEVSVTGVARFFINGNPVGLTMAGAVTPAVALTPTIVARSLAANSKTFDVDYVNVMMNR